VVGGSEAIEVDLALARDQEYFARAVFQAPFVVSLGSAEDALLRWDDSSLPEKHDFLELTEEGGFLLLVEGMKLDLVTGEQRETLDTLRDAGTAVEEDGAWRVALPIGANVVLHVGEASIMLKCRAVSEPGAHVEAVGDPHALVCGRCGADLTLVMDIPHVLSPCPRCQTRNRITTTGPEETDQGAEETELGVEETDQGAEETELGLEEAEPGLEEAEPGLDESDSRGDLERQQDSADFDEQATEPGLPARDLRGEAPMEVAVGGEAVERLASAPTQLVDAEEKSAGEAGPEVEAAEVQPRKRRRPNKRRDRSPWTLWLVSLVLVGLASGALGLGLIFYAVVIRSAGG